MVCYYRSAADIRQWHQRVTPEHTNVPWTTSVLISFLFAAAQLRENPASSLAAVGSSGPKTDFFIKNHIFSSPFFHTWSGKLLALYINLSLHSLSVQLLWILWIHYINIFESITKIWIHYINPPPILKVSSFIKYFSFVMSLKSSFLSLPFSKGHYLIRLFSLWWKWLALS